MIVCIDNIFIKGEKNEKTYTYLFPILTFIFCHWL